MPWWQFLMELEFPELKLHDKLKFEELEFQNCGISLYNS